MPSPCHLSPSPELGHQRVAPVSRVGGLPKLRSQGSHLLLLLDLCGEAECRAPGASLTGSWGMAAVLPRSRLLAPTLTRKGHGA